VPGEDLIKKAKKELNSFFPTVVLWILRFSIGFQAYLYHTNLNMFHLLFVLSTFVFSGRFATFVGAVVMLPIYCGEFIMIYSLNIPYVKDTKFIQTFG